MCFNNIGSLILLASVPKMKFNHCFCFLLLAVLGTVQGDGPPPGPKNQAKCPVTGEDIAIASSTASVQFTHGQKLYFSSENAASLYQKNPRNFWLSPHELPLKGPDGKRGLPDMRNATVVCPSSGENFTVTMSTPRVIHRYGQNVFFCCFGCVSEFWTNPESMIES